MASYVLSTYDITDSNAVVTDNPSVEWQQTTATDFVTPTWSSINRAISPTDTLQNNFNSKLPGSLLNLDSFNRVPISTIFTI